jgi:hypothetical protein
MALAALLIVAGCSSDDDSAEDAVPAPETAQYSVPAPEVSPPPAEGAETNEPLPNPALPEGYTEEELFLSGTATSFQPVDTPNDGAWTVELDDEADYRTRVIVRRPSPERFSGTVIVEWLNVSAFESSPDWAYLSEEIGREGHAYVAVSAQAQGVEGGDTLLDVDVDEESAAEVGASTDKSGLKGIDPERYGTLVHPGDAYSFDIYSQVGRAVSERPDDVLGGLVPKQVIAIGQSQSAGFLSTVVNAVHPLDPVYDGFLIHSRGANPAPLEGRYARSSDAEGDDEGTGFTEGAVLLRNDLDVPVMLFETETDLTLLGYSKARQEDTDSVRTWEVAGTSHADAHMIRSMLGGPRDAGSGELLGCTEPINTGPQHEVLQAALHHVVEWVAGGDAPPSTQRIELDEDGEPASIVRDEHQIAIGGARTPLVDVPIAATTGDPPGGGGGSGICFLFGTTIPFDQATLVDQYGTFDAYLEEFTASTADAVSAGILLPPDADALIDEAALNEPLFG